MAKGTQTVLHSLESRLQREVTLEHRIPALGSNARGLGASGLAHWTVDETQSRCGGSPDGQRHLIRHQQALCRISSGQADAGVMAPCDNTKRW
jgi:hypothetical protein